jgi:hypothetical protein
MLPVSFTEGAADRTPEDRPSGARVLDDAWLDGVLHEVVETLAPLDRTPCSPGERQAAEWLAARLRGVPGVEVALEDEPSWGTFPPTAAALGLLGMAGAGLVLRGRRAIGAVLAVKAFAAIVDEAQNGPRVARRLLRRRRTTVNLVARTGESETGPSGSEGNESEGNESEGNDERPVTLVVLAHHDAAQTGMFFDQRLQRRLHELAPSVLERFKTPLPQWWIGLAGPLCTLAGALLGRPRLARVGLGIGAAGTALVADIWRNETVPGANDNLSAAAALVALAELLGESPVPGLRVLLVSCGAEETLQDGVRAFIARHRGELEPGRTAFVNLDTVGSPHLVMLEAEGPVWMEYYTGPWLNDLVAERADGLGIELQRGFRARASTDSVIPSRAGYPIATLVSVTDWLSPANYHLPSDVPANLDYGSVADATRLTLAIAQALPGAMAGAVRS